MSNAQIVIRQADARRDAAAILAVYAPYIRKTAITFEKEVPDTAAFVCRIEGIAGAFPYLVLEENGEIVGYAYAHRQAERAAFDWNAELSIYMKESCTGKGYGKPLYSLLMRLLEMQGYVNLYAVITGSNARSIAIHEQMGFVRCGHHVHTGYKFDQWHDTVWLCRRLHEGAPKEIIRFDALDRWETAREIAAALEAIGRRKEK